MTGPSLRSDDGVFVIPSPPHATVFFSRSVAISSAS